MTPSSRCWGGSSDPKRFYAHPTDEDPKRIVTSVFDLHSFKRIPQGWNGMHFQSLILRKRALDPSC